MTTGDFGPYLSAKARAALEGGEPFGVCPECGSARYRNIYKTHFFYCEEHRITWVPGYNLMSSWQYEEPEDWRAAWEQLKEYRTVDGFGQYQPGARLGEQTTLEALMPTWDNKPDEDEFLACLPDEDPPPKGSHLRRIK